MREQSAGNALDSEVVPDPLESLEDGLQMALLKERMVRSDSPSDRTDSPASQIPANTPGQSRDTLLQ